MPIAVRDATTAVLLPSRVAGRPERAQRSWPLSAGGPALADLVRVVLTLTLVGALVLAVQLLVDGDRAGTVDASVLRTGYGSAEVGDVTVSAAVPAAGKGLVGTGTAGTGHTAHTGADGVRVHVPITLSNDSDAPVDYRPRQFRLDDGSGRAVVPQDNPLLTGVLRPGAAVSLRLSFALPVGTDRLRLLVDGGPPAGLDLHLPGARATQQQTTPQDSAPAPAPSTGHGH